ncbi:hypothetical protein [Actinomadura sp. CNU-125]|uniref:hypothetical protein n=1 Tax=Actinomadura sp. CNU-125 TaxID=1904961 RepID=UPI0039677974
MPGRRPPRRRVLHGSRGPRPGDRPGGGRRLATVLAHLGKPDGEIVELDRGYRVPAEIVDYAARLLPRIAPGLGVPESVRRSADALRVTEAASGRLAASVASACEKALVREGSVGLIAADADVAALHGALAAAGLRPAVLGDDEDAMRADRLVVVPATLVKGLEFETVVVAEPANIVRAEPRGLHRLYVVLTRAVSALHIVHSEPLPEPLDGRVTGPRPIRSPGGSAQPS